MKITYLPPQDTPDWAKEYTATTPGMLWSLRNGRIDFTINQKVLDMWAPKPVGTNFEDKLSEMIKKMREQK